jgi:hypothetical protein
MIAPEPVPAKPRPIGSPLSSPPVHDAVEVENVDVAVDARVAGDDGLPAGDPEADENATRTRIAERAYAIYLSRNGDGGDALSDWLEAERQVRDSPSAM